jgi:hypothetical protein
MSNTGKFSVREWLAPPIFFCAAGRCSYSADPTRRTLAISSGERLACRDATNLVIGSGRAKTSIRKIQHV